MSLTKVTYSMINGAAFNVLDYGADSSGVADSSAAIQLALDEASPVYGTVYFPPGTYKVSSTLNAGTASIYGSATRQATINYTGSSNLFGDVNAYGILFTGTGKAGTGIAIKIINGYRNLIQNCHFNSIGTGIQISGSGQKVTDSLFTSCGVGLHVVKYSPSFGNEPTTTFTSEKNWYELCNKGLWIDSTGAVSGMISCSSKDDIFQLNTGYGLFLSSTTWPFTLINPHTEQNSAGGNYAIGFGDGSTVIWIGGYQAGGENNYFGNNLTIQNLAYSGIFAITPYRVNNEDGSKYFFEANNETSVMNFPCQQGDMRQLFTGGGYSSTNSAFIDLQGGFGDNGFYYGSFIESQRTSAIGDGVNTHFGFIEKGAVSDTYARRLTINYLGALYPVADNSQALGGPSNLWSVVYAGTGTINTSDEREKQQIKPIDDAALRAWAKVEYCQFKFNDAVEKKGDGARWHVGLIAQRVKEAFESEGLDAFYYGLLCFDKWDDEYEDVSKEETYTDEAGLQQKRWVFTGEKRKVKDAGEKYGIRYEEALTLECAYLRSKLK